MKPLAAIVTALLVAMGIGYRRDVGQWLAYVETQSAEQYANPVRGSRLTMHADTPFAMYHRRCGGLAFFISHRPVVGGPALAASDVAMSDGRRPVSGELARCSTCGRVVDFSYRGDNGLCFEGECE